WGGVTSDRSRWQTAARRSAAYWVDSLRWTGVGLCPCPVSESPGARSTRYSELLSRPRVMGTYTAARSAWPTSITTRAESTVTPWLECPVVAYPSWPWLARYYRGTTTPCWLSSQLRSVNSTESIRSIFQR